MPPPATRNSNNAGLEKALMWGAVGAGAIAAAIGGLHLIFWLSGALSERAPDTFTIKTNASLCIFLCGISLMLAVNPRAGEGKVRIARVFAGLAALIAGLTFLEHLSGVDLGIDQLLAKEQPGAPGVLHPNRMGPPGSLGGTLCGIALLLLLNRRRKLTRLVQGIGIAICLISMLGILGHFYGITGLYAAPRSTAIAWPAAASLFLLGTGLLLARPREAVTATFTSGTPGSAAGCRLLLPAILLPVLLGWLVLQGERHGLYGHGLGTGVLVLLLIVLFSTIVYQVVKRTEMEIKAAEDQLTRETLRDSEQRLKTIIDGMAEGLIIIDPASGNLQWNRKALEMYGQEAEPAGLSRLDGLRYRYELATLQGELVPLEQWPLARVLRGEEFHDLDLAVRDLRHGWQRIITFSGVLIRDEHGASRTGLMNLRDITMRKEAEEEVRQSEELLRTVLETLPIGVWILSADGTVLHSNKAAQQIWGAAPQVGIDQYAVFQGWRPETGEKISPEDWGAARAIRKGETSLNEDVEIESFDGRRKIILASAVPIRNRGGEVVGAISVNQDITAAKQAQDTVRESEEKFRAVFQQAAVGMGRVSFADARWVDVNDAFCRMLGYSREEMLSIPWTEITHPDDLDLDLVPFRQMAAGKLESYSVEKRFLHKGGGHLWARLTLSLVRDSQGAPDYEVAIIEDISHRKEAEEALHRAKDELELRVRERTRELEEAYGALQRETAERLAAVEDLREKEQLLVQQSRMAAMGEMLGNIAHQWRQPLNVLGLMVQKLRFTFDKGQLDSETMRDEVSKAMNVIKHMSQTIDDFKDFLKEEKERREFSVNGAVSATIALLEAQLKNANIAVELDQLSELLVTGHRNEFSHVVMNLITNARDALREKAIESPKIVIRLFQEDGRKVVTISDNAGGVPEDIIGRIFDPYFTTKGPDKGTGIGLFMSKNIIEKNMHGRLSVRNSGEGAEFRIEL